MNDLRVSKTGIGFALAATVAITGSAFAAGGEDPTTATVITSLPFSDTGDTSIAVDDFDAVCPFSGSTSGDLFYSYTPAADMLLEVDLCDSAYDTKTYVLDSGFFEVGCNDDACSSPGGGGFRSLLQGVSLLAGVEYYIAVDGWSGDAGIYLINVDEFVPPPACEVECPNGSVDEGEPCDDGLSDTNGGCNFDPAAPIFTDISCGDVVCGTAWGTGGTRDTDWYRITLASDDAVTMSQTLLAGFNGAFGYIPAGDPAAPDCALAAAIDPFNTTSVDDCGTSASISFIAFAAGDYWFFTGTTDFDLVSCAAPLSPQTNDYVATFDCEPLCDGGSSCAGDANGDGVVNFGDITSVLANWNTTCP